MAPLVALLVSCGATNDRATVATSLPPALSSSAPCKTPHPAPSLSPADVAQVAAARSAYEQIIAQMEPARLENTKRLDDALKRADAAGAQTAVAHGLSQTTMILDFLRSVTVPLAMQPDTLSFLRAEQNVLVADQTFVAVRTHNAIRNALHQRVFYSVLAENAGNQFRVDLGMTPFPCPYNGP